LMTFDLGHVTILTQIDKKNCTWSKTYIGLQYDTILSRVALSQEHMF
jgi:hypothetical protein